MQTLVWMTCSENAYQACGMRGFKLNHHVIVNCCQIANALSEHCAEKLGSSEFWADDGQTGSNPEDFGEVDYHM